MKKLFLFLSFLFLTRYVYAEPVYNWTYNQSVSACSAITTGKARSLCWENSTGLLYKCQPNAGEAGTCTTAAEWKAVGGAFTDDGVNVYPRNAGRGWLLGTSLLKGNVNTGIQIDTNADGVAEVIMFPTGMVRTTGGLEYVGINPYLNVARTTDKTLSLTAGDVWYRSDTKTWVFYDGAVNKQLATKQFFSIPIPSPSSSSNRLLFKAPYNMKVTSINCIIDPSDTTDTAPLLIQECNSSGDSCASLDSTITCSNAGAADDGSITDTNIASGNWINANIATITGTITNLTIQVNYEILQ